MTYKNLEIKLTSDNMFYCDEFELTTETYKEITKLIDKELSKDKKGFKRIPVIFSRWSHSGKDKYINAEITSILEDKKTVWITREDKRREKTNIEYLYEHSESNLKIISEIKDTENKIKELERLRQSKTNLLTKIKLN